VLAEIGFAKRPILEIISTNADRDIDDSVARLVKLDWGHQHVAMRETN
jgi:hypothetical protein